MNDCQVIPNQNIKIIRPLKIINSREFKSEGSVFRKKIDDPNNAFIQVRKKKVGASKYKSIMKKIHNTGNKSRKKPKKRISETNIIEPGNPKKTSEFSKEVRKSFGHKKFKPLTSVIRRVLNRLAIASTSKNEFVDKSA